MADTSPLLPADGSPGPEEEGGAGFPSDVIFFHGKVSYIVHIVHVQYHIYMYMYTQLHACTITTCTWSCAKSDVRDNY